jgi:hypothetical protein
MREQPTHKKTPAETGGRFLEDAVTSVVRLAGSSGPDLDCFGS